MVNNHNHRRIVGRYVDLREAEVSDSAFILQLRTDAAKSRFIHKTAGNLSAQENYMRRYKAQHEEWYFIIEDKSGKTIGTNRVSRYPLLHESWQDPLDPSKGIMGPGSWLLIDGLSPFQSMESDLLIKKFFFGELGHNLHPMYIHKDNIGVLNFHQRWWGAEIVGFNQDLNHHLLNLTRSSYEDHLSRVEQFIYRKGKNDEH